MDENEFEINGVTYEAISSGGTCLGCSFFSPVHVKDRCDKIGVPACTKDVRIDGRTIIFAEKQQ